MTNMLLEGQEQMAQAIVQAINNLSNSGLNVGNRVGTKGRDDHNLGTSNAVTQTHNITTSGRSHRPLLP